MAQYLGCVSQVVAVREGKASLKRTRGSRSARRAVGGGEQVGSDSEQLRYSFQGGGGLDDDPPVLIIGQALAEVAEQERGALDADQVS